MVTFEYTVTNKETDKSRIVLVNAEDLINHYGVITKPNPMFVKDIACKKGIFDWSEYTKLKVKRLLY